MNDERVTNTHNGLLPCPRCGSAAEVVHASHIRCSNTYNCDCETRLGERGWNRRQEMWTGEPLPRSSTAGVPIVVMVEGKDIDGYDKTWFYPPDSPYVQAHREDPNSKLTTLFAFSATTGGKSHG